MDNKTQTDIENISTECLVNLYIDTFHTPPQSMIKLQGDGSDRQIYRLCSTKRHPVIGIIGQNIAENRAFIAFSRHFAKHKLPVPEILAVDEAESVYLEADLGDLTLYNRIQSEAEFNRACLQYYEQVLYWLPKFQITAGKDLDYSFCYQSTEFAREAMIKDFEYFCNRFLAYFYKVHYDRDQLSSEFDRLLEHLLFPQRDFFLYRDFQSRNIMLVNEQPHFIDYQSGRHGALQYDIASLLFDAKARVPASAREHLLQYYISRVQELIDVNVHNFMDGFYPYVWMRVMQALGAYGFLSQVKGKPNFLSNIPPALHNIKYLLDVGTVMDSLPVLKTIFINLVNDQSLYTLGK